MALQAERSASSPSGSSTTITPCRGPTDEITFESFTWLAALAALTTRVRLGHIVICTAFRNPALTAKMICTMDAISAGRMELGIGAGWKRDEWLAYGYGFPETKARLARLGDDLEVITRMLAPGRAAHATFAGTYAHVRDAINVPKPVQQPRVPIMVGGNGPNVTWRLAARYADELNVDGLEPREIDAAMPLIRARCEEIGRDPATLPISVHIWHEQLPRPARPGWTSSRPTGKSASAASRRSSGHRRPQTTPSPRSQPTPAPRAPSSPEVRDGSRPTPARGCSPDSGYAPPVRVRQALRSAPRFPSRDPIHSAP